MQFRLGVQSWTIAIFSVAVVLRVAWLIAYPGVIENEGAEYARLAENLLESGSYHGNFGPHVWFPHLFPGFIAGLTIVLGDSEIAARFVSLIAGLLYIVAVGRLTEAMAGKEAARLAQIVAASHGLLVALSASAYSEMTYMCLLTWGLYYGIRAVESTQVRIALIAGAFFALSFLVRPQAIIYPFITAAFIAGAGIAKRRSIRQSATAVTAMVLAFAILIAPYVAWLSASSGYFRIEGKTVVNSVTSARMQSGMGYREAVRGLGPNLEPAGVYTYSDQFAVPKPAISRTITKSIFAEFPQRVSLLIRQFLTTKGLGWIAFLGLAVLGLVRAVYLRGKFLEAGYYAFIGLSYLAILFSMQFGWSRHLFPLSILLIPWVGIGAAFLWEYLKGKLMEIFGDTAIVKRGHPLFVVLVAAAVAVPSVIGAAQLSEFDQSRATELKSAGQWIGDQPNSDVIMGLKAAVAYYASARLVYPPWTDEEKALRYIRMQDPGFIYISAWEGGQAPYLQKWLDDGIPDPCAELVKTVDGRHGESSVWIYEWRCDP